MEGPFGVETFLRCKICLGARAEGHKGLNQYLCRVEMLEVRLATALLLRYTTSFSGSNEVKPFKPPFCVGRS